MALRRFQRTAYRLFGGRAARRSAENPRLGVMLQRALIPLRSDVYLASGYMAMLIAAGGAFLVVLLLLGLELTGVVEVPLRLTLVLLPAPLLIAIVLYTNMMIMPDVRAMTRGRDIDAKLPYALNYIATMSGAGATPAKVFSDLARNDLYGEITKEAQRIDRDLTVLGHDIVTALSRAIDRTPSTKFQDFLQGAITTLTSGGDLKRYFLAKSEQYLYENRQDQVKFLDSLGVLAESFVVVVVAAPLFLIVLLSVLTTFGSSATDVMFLGYAIVLVLLPLSQLAFALTIKTITPEV